MVLKRKFIRYKNLIRDFKNWPDFLVFKSNQKDIFRFKMRNGFEVDIKRQLLPPFKESFFDRVYFEGFSDLTFLDDNPNVLDIGGNIGSFSLFVYSQSPKANLFSFEPMPFNFKQMMHFKASYPDMNWKVENKAVSGNNDPLILYTSTTEEFSTMAGVFKDERRTKEIEVECVTFTDIKAKYDLSKIDLVKLDCEGSEYSIFESMTNEEIHLVDRYVIETHPGNGVNENHNYLLSFMKANGYNVKDKMNPDKSGYIWAWK